MARQTNNTALYSYHFACWVILHAFRLSSVDFFQNQVFRKKFLQNAIRVSNSLDPDQARQNVAPDLGPNCLQRYSADDTSRQRVNGSMFVCFIYPILINNRHNKGSPAFR